VKTSVLLAAMAATIVAGLTFVMAWIAQRSLPRYGFILDALAFAPIAIPGVIVGAGILVAYLMLPIPIYNTIWILLVAYVTLYLPYGMRFASSGITQIHRELEEVAAVSGAGLGQIFARIMLPLLAPVLLAGWIYVFVLAVRELGASIFLVGPGTHVLGDHQPHHVGGGRQLRRGRGARASSRSFRSPSSSRAALDRVAHPAAGASRRRDGAVTVHHWREGMVLRTTASGAATARPQKSNRLPDRSGRRSGLTPALFFMPRDCRIS
jgi:hypothetical protein